MQKKLDLMKTPEGESFLLFLKVLTENRIYSNERAGRSFNFGFSKGALIQGRRTFEGGAH